MKPIGKSRALKILKMESIPEILGIFSEVSRARERHFGRRIEACSIVNAKSGGCSQDCSFCAQSKRSKASISAYPLISAQEIVKAARTAEISGAARIGIVISGLRPSEKELDSICRAIDEISSRLKISVCASLGILGYKSLSRLRDAGLRRYHHNLETSESYYPSICSTRDYKAQLDGVANAKSAGLEICSGGLFGLGESLEQRIELLGTLKQIGVNCIPVNFLHPVEGTPLGKTTPPVPMECLKIIAAARLMMPSTSIRICGGREHCLRDMQSWIFAAGADAFMIGGYLTTSGRNTAMDIQMAMDFGTDPEITA